MEEMVITLDMDFAPETIDTFCFYCEKPLVLKHEGMGRYKGVCSCGQSYRASKRIHHIKPLKKKDKK